MTANNKTRIILGVTAALSLSLLAERIGDPLDRHGNNYTLEGPQSHDGGFYLTSNYYDAVGDKHDDRKGDIIIVTTLLSGLGYVATRSSGAVLAQRHGVTQS